MGTSEINDFIKEIELFKDLDDQERALVASNLVEKTYPANTVLFEENCKRDHIYIIYDGQVELFKTTPFGEEKKLAIFSKDDFLGEAAIIDNSAHSTSAKTTTPTTVFWSA